MASYNISVGNVARTLLYEDSFGTILFSFDVDASGGGEFLILERPLSRLNEINTVKDGRTRTIQHARVSLAFDRTRKHLMQQGHQVKIWPDEFETPSEQKSKMAG